MKIKLQRCSAANSEIFRNWISSPDLLFQWTGDQFIWPIDDKQIKAYSEKLQTLPTSLISFNAIEEDSGKLVGQVDLSDIHMPSKRATIIRVLVKPELQNLGHGSAMMKEVVQYGFQELKLNRLDLKVFDFNKAAMHCYEKLGFIYEGTLREVVYYNAKFWDLHIMSLLKTEWENNLLE